jgi:serine/threonine protein kinase
MAPEIINHVPHDHRVDIWSLGVLLYELVHGKPPFYGLNECEKLNKIVEGKSFFVN